MRFLQSVLLLIFLGAIGTFAYQNNQPLTVSLGSYSLTTTVAGVVAGVYLLGMLTGWTVVSYLRRSIRRATQAPQD